MDKVLDILHMPKRLFKYYGYNTTLNSKRLSGEIYLACPFDFNDPCDCQRGVINNTSKRVEAKGHDWLETKLQELDYTKEESEEIAESLLKNDEKVIQVYKRMLEKMGILCLTSNQSDTLMWGYYANNEGFCIEYDVSKIIKSITIGYINQMSYTTAKFLYDKEKYCEEPKRRTPNIATEMIEKAMIFKSNDTKQISNKFLTEQEDEQNILNFIHNIFLKRIYARSIEYGVPPKGSPAPLFFNRGDKDSETKYFKKTKTWEHEKEFRFIVSLGGRMVIKLGKKCIKNIYLGCNMSNEKINSIIYIMTMNQMNAGLYKMKRNKNCGLSYSKIEWKKLQGYYGEIEESLKNK